LWLTVSPSQKLNPKSFCKCTRSIYYQQQDKRNANLASRSIAGSDTTATAIRSTILHLITNPRVLEKFREEIASTRFDADIIPDAVAKEMPYLQAIIKEGLRIFPPVAGLMAKEAPPEGDTWKGVYIPGGTRIGYGAWGIYRNKAIYGDDASEFRPERWLEGPEDKIKEMESTLELIFSYGRYQCLGKPVALIELNKVFVHVSLSMECICLLPTTNIHPQLLTHFDLVVCDPQKPWLVKNPGIFHQSEFWIRANGREVA
jgi:hypothetical protein